MMRSGVRCKRECKCKCGDKCKWMHEVPSEGECKCANSVRVCNYDYCFSLLYSVLMWSRHISLISTITVRLSTSSSSPIRSIAASDSADVNAPTINRVRRRHDASDAAGIRDADGIIVDISRCKSSRLLTRSQS